MGRGRSGGCMDHQFRKPSEPWELADGLVWVCPQLNVVSIAHFFSSFFLSKYHRQQEYCTYTFRMNDKILNMEKMERGYLPTKMPPHGT